MHRHAEYIKSEFFKQSILSLVFRCSILQQLIATVEKFSDYVRRKDKLNLNLTML